MVGAVQLESEEQDLVFITSDAQLLRFGAAAVQPAGQSRVQAWPGSGSRRVPSCSGLARSIPRADRRIGRSRVPGATGAPVVVTVAGSARTLPGTGASQRQGDPLRGVPAEGPQHRRRPLPPLPQGRRRARARLGWPRTGQGRDRGRHASAAAAAAGPQGRLRRARQGAARGRGRSGAAVLNGD